MSGIGQRIVQTLASGVERIENEIADLNNALIAKQIEINDYDEMIKALDNKMTASINNINGAIEDVGAAYENQIAVGCKSGLKWVLSGISTGDRGQEIATYTCIRIEQSCFNRYGIQFEKKPCNRTYDLNIVAEYGGSVGVGSTVFFVDSSNYSVYSPDETNSNVNFADNSGLQVGDFITDDVDDPVIFVDGALPTIVGFSSAVNAFSTGIKTSFTGNILNGQNVLAIQGATVSQLGIEVGDFVYANGVTNNAPSKEYSATTVTGFTTAFLDLEAYYTNTGFGTTTVVCEALTLSDNAVSSASTITFFVGVGTVVPALILSDSPTGVATNGNFTFIRNTELYTQFGIDKNPIDPTSVGIFGVNGNSGDGKKIFLVNNGSESTIQSYAEAREETKPSVGAGKECYRIGNDSWPIRPFGGGYAVEGDVAIGAGGTVNPFIAGYTSTPPGSDCAAQETAVTNAISARGTAITVNSNDINKLINATNTIRDSRHQSQLQAWSILQAINEAKKKRIDTTGALDVVKDANFDVLPD